jgi:hypothetical protein
MINPENPVCPIMQKLARQISYVMSQEDSADFRSSPLPGKDFGRAQEFQRNFLKAILFLLRKNPDPFPSS